MNESGDDIAKNITDKLNMMNDGISWIVKNLNRLPLSIQLKFLEETMRYADVITPMYISSLYLYGDQRKED